MNSPRAGTQALCVSSIWTAVAQPICIWGESAKNEFQAPWTINFTHLSATKTPCNSRSELLLVVQLLSHVRPFAISWTAACQAPLSSTASTVCSNSCPLSWWHNLAISSSAAHFSSSLQSFPASGSFPMSWLFTSGGQSIGASAIASVLPMNI